MDDNNELIIYVLQQLRQGVPEQAVRNILAQNGWPQPLIDRAFSMVQQARPHEVAPPTGTLPQALPPESALPAPAENPYPILEDERKLEKRSNRRRRAFIATLIILLLAGIGAGVFFFTQKKEPTPKKETQKTTQAATSNPDTQRKERIDGLSAELIHYYDEKGTYPTFTQLNSPDFATSKSGFDITKYRDPSWDAKKPSCADDKGRAILVATRIEGCFTYRATAVNGEDCDGNEKKCTRAVITTTLQNKKPHIVALDQNKKE
jgi:hypothetical protein